MLTKLKNVVRLSTVLLALHIGSTNAAQNPEYSGIHGSACQPIFLQQALDLGLKWTRAGVFNDNALGSGVFFWVACPISHTDDQTGANGADAWAQIFYNDRDTSAGTRTYCFAMRQDHNDHDGSQNGSGGQIGSRPDAVDTNMGTGPYATRLEMVDIIQSADQAYHGNRESFSVACKLYPQAGVRAVTIDFD